MLPHIRQIINESDSDLLIVLHTYGSHYDYRKRYPQEFAQYKPDLISAINTSNRSTMVNAYDNSVYYTDYVLDQLIQLLEQSNACTALLYCSDHGEDMMDDTTSCMWHRLVGFRPVIANFIRKNMQLPLRMKKLPPPRLRYSIR